MVRRSMCSRVGLVLIPWEGEGSLDNVGGGEGLSDDVGDDIREEVVREGPAVV